MHPYYGPSEALAGGRDSSWSGLVSMAAYLAFWAIAIPVTMKVLKPHLPPAAGGPAPDAAVGILRERYARGEITFGEFAEMRANLDRTAP